MRWSTGLLYFSDFIFLLKNSDAHVVCSVHLALRVSTRGRTVSQSGRLMNITLMPLSEGNIQFISCLVSRWTPTRIHARGFQWLRLLHNPLSIIYFKCVTFTFWYNVMLSQKHTLLVVLYLCFIQTQILCKTYLHTLLPFKMNWTKKHDSIWQ